MEGTYSEIPYDELVVVEPGGMLTVSAISSRQPSDSRLSTLSQAVTFLALPVCAIKAFVDLSQEHEHGEEVPAYPYLRIRSKEFPWGDSGLFETEH